ncbi:MAG: HDIG domain-containing protein [Anaerolineales bacterium]|nr:HDIG domain-containing protein [Anaerolineales bacterium]
MDNHSEIPWWQRLVRGSFWWLFAVAMAVAVTLILSFNLVRPSNISVSIGLPAANDVFAPRSVTYTSDILTAQAQEQARNSVPDVYTTMDLTIGRAQLSWARAVFAFAEVVRADTQSTDDTKLRYLQSISGLMIDSQVAQGLLSLGPADYEVAKTAVLAVIEELMSQEIRPDQLSDFQRLARRPSLVLSETQDRLVTNLAYQFIVPNVFLNEETTEERRSEAVSEVAPITRSISEGQRVVRAGDIITELDVEMLEQLGLLQAETDWRDVGSIFLASMLSVVIAMLYWQHFHEQYYSSGRYFSALVILVLIFTILAKLMAASPAILIYWYPISTLAMLVAVIFGLRLSIMVTILIAAMVGFIAPNSLELSMYMASGGLLAILLLRDAQRVNAFFRAGLAAAVGHIAVIIIFQLPQNSDVVGVLELILFALGNGVLSAALTLVGFFLLGSLFGVITILQLQELTRLDHPLLQELLRKAPGTYHHSIMVANLAEQAAERVKSTNSALVRVGAFYHDIGKMKRPVFFTENQEGVNPHDALDPQSSVDIIVGHVSEGLELARRYRLPLRIRDFIAEHHGDRVVKGFYLKALAAVNGDETQVEQQRFRHRGPRPRSRETGLVMLADSVEATSSALRPSTEKAIEKLVNSLVDEHVTEGQLNDSGLTLGDIQLIRASFIETLKGRFHVRVKYPGNEALEQEGPPVGAAVETAVAPRPLPAADGPPVVLENGQPPEATVVDPTVQEGQAEDV